MSADILLFTGVRREPLNLIREPECPFRGPPAATIPAFAHGDPVMVNDYETGTEIRAVVLRQEGEYVGVRAGDAGCFSVHVSTLTRIEPEAA